jgi:hypothetical protein
MNDYDDIEGLSLRDTLLWLALIIITAGAVFCFAC